MMSRTTEKFNCVEQPEALGTSQTPPAQASPDAQAPPDATAVPANPVESPAEDKHAPPVDRRRRRRVRRAIVLGLVIVIGFAGAAVGYSMLQPTVYGAQADFILTARPELSDAAVDRAMVTQTMIIQSDPVLRPVANQLGLPLSQVRDAVAASMVGRSNVLRLTVGDRDRDRAVALAGLISAEYLRMSGGTTGSTASSASDRTTPITATVLATAAPLDRPLQPQPMRALAAGVLVGLLVAGAVVLMMWRPRFLTRPTPHWQ
jgi:uncharacterized protein involved in exopolysaccharide biosynthesis